MRFLFVLLLLTTCNLGLGQVKADFVMDKFAGCSPLQVSFSNTSSGITPNAKFSWDFGNGNTSVQKDPSAIYVQEGTFTIRLTVSDGNRTSSVTRQVTIYKKPEVDLTPSITKGCAPLVVDFTTAIKPGDGSITTYSWDFGDGQTASVSTPNYKHTYTSSQPSTVSLTVTNSFGCYATIEKKNLVNVIATPQVDFKPETGYLCRVGDELKMLNLSSGAGTLSYAWDFGDGNTSSAKEPLHRFNKAGAFTVKLKVTNEQGCSATKTKTDVLNVANFTSSIDLPNAVCPGTSYSVRNTSSPKPDAYTWQVDGIDYFQATPGDISLKLTEGIHTIRLINTIGGCMDTLVKLFTVRAPIDLKGFVAEVVDRCKYPNEYVFRDTSARAVSWMWVRNFTEVGTKNETRLSFYSNGTDSVALRVFDSAGCMSAVTQKIVVRMPDASINVVIPPLGAPMLICGSGDRTLEVESTDNFVKYEWLSGNGQTSTAASPVFRYDKFGSYRPEVKLTTNDGCVIQRIHPYAIVVRDSVKADFKMDQLICGNNEVVVKNTSVLSPNSDLSEYSYYVNFGDGYSQSINSPNEITYRYKDTGTYTIKMEVNDMVCFDSITRINHVRVLPPMAILYRGVERNCDDNRGKVKIGYNAKYAVSGTLDFGDGTIVPVIPGEVYVEHEYAKTGWYNVVLTTTNGSCTGRDSLRMGVYRKQQPLLSADRSEVCDYNEFVRFRLMNLEIVPTEYYGFFEATLQNSDGQTITPITYFQTGVPDSTILVIGNFFKQFSNGQIRMILRHQVFGCMDTTNWITLNIGRPFSSIRSSVRSCTNGRTVYFTDSSTTAAGRKIVQWEWYFGTEQRKVTTQQSQELSYTFTRDGLNPVRLVVTDDKGCSTETTTTVFVSNGAVKASFTTASNTVSPGTVVKFTNTSSTYDPANTIYNWNFGDGTLSVENNPEKTFSQPGIYSIKLGARNTLTGCIDSTVSQLLVKEVNAAFSMRSSFITRDNCLPMQVQFTNTSSNTVRVFWDFGDGVTSIMPNPTHFYTKSGTYVITQSVFSDNGTMYVTTDTVRVTVPSIKLSADSLMGCADQLSNFTARADYASRFAWDFGDGIVVTNGDSSMTHRFTQAGVYSPRIILFDASGCAVAATLTDSIRIDSLAVSITGPNGQFCAPKTISFGADVATAVKGQLLSYVWTSGAQTASTENVSFLFDKAGSYPIQLTVTTQYGCTSTVTRQLVGMQGLGGILNGPDSICSGNKGSFNATTQIAGTPIFQWTFPDGSTSAISNPPAYAFNVPGNQTIRLVVDNGGCQDTVLKTVAVNPTPVDVVSLAEAGICRETELVMIGTNASAYEWTPAPGLTQLSGAQVTAIPLDDVTYRVKATTIHGCVVYDSVKVKVFQPIKLVLEPEVITCPGVPVQLNASGAIQYTWIGNTSGLSATSIGNPRAIVDGPATFTVVGVGESKCFSDTASIKVLLHAKPTVDAGPGAEISVGSSFQLNPVVSSDVKKYLWSPDKFLSCTGCVSPVSTPSEEVTYTLTVTNEKGCTALDTVTVAVLCSESKIFIPNAFTPNGDGSNDRFTFNGSGIKIVKSLKIFNRFGSLIFERKNFAVNDPSAAWDGKVKGMLVPVGSYVYMAELSCDTKSFVRKGSVTVLY